LAISKNLENIADGFSEPKKRLLYYLKVMQHAGLEELAEAMYAVPLKQNYLKNFWELI
jgi:hypothetical protein